METNVELVANREYLCAPIAPGKEVITSPDPWDCSDADPIQDFINAFWTKDPKSCIEKYGNKVVKSMIPEKDWPKK